VKEKLDSMPVLECQNLIRKLLRAALRYQAREKLTDYVSSQDEMPIWDLFLITMPDLREKYWKAFVALNRELVPNYMSAQDVYVKLWELFREVTLNGNYYQSKVNLDSKLMEFCQSVKKPLQTVDIIYEIKNLDIGTTKFNLSNVEVSKVTTEYLESLGFRAGISTLQDRILEKWVGKSVAKLEVNVSDIDRAYESGSAVVNTVLDVMKLAAVTQTQSRLIGAMFLWELGEGMAIARVKTRKGSLLSASSDPGFPPLIVPMDNSIQKGFEDWNTWKYVLDGNLPKEINVHVVRAMRWISHAVSSSSLDYKLVDLCTALETLLLPNYKAGTKGELISLRQVLVGGGTHYVPTAILYLYEKRSNIVHRGTLEITSYSEYWHLLLCCLQVLKNIVRLSMQYPQIETLAGLIGAVETADSLQRFIRYCEIGLYDGQGIDDIKKVANEQLAKLKSDD
jgi:hypothetical protein